MNGKMLLRWNWKHTSAYVSFAEFSKAIMRVFSIYEVQLVEDQYSAKQWR